MKTDRAPGPSHQTVRLVAGFAAAAILLCSFSLPSPASQSKASRASKLEHRINVLIRESGAETVAVAFHDLGTGAGLLINPDQSFHAASTMKVPVMMELYRQKEAGKFSLDDQVPIKNDFASIADGSRYSLSPDDDSELTLYKRVGQTASVRELLHLMITVSSNLATNILIERVGAANVVRLMRRYGANHIRVLRGVEDSKAFERGMNNTTTARDLMILLRRIAEGRGVSQRASDEMLKVLLDQKFSEGIPSGLPGAARVAHKTGSITKLYHDAAIVLLPSRKPYVLVVLTRGLEDEKRAHKLVADISREVYGVVTGTTQPNTRVVFPLPPADASSRTKASRPTWVPLEVRLGR
ncbi:MAG: serine hydrolase [Acidobacteriota bacterium]